MREKPDSDRASAARTLGEFADAQSMVSATRVLAAAGFDRVTTFAPFDVPEVDAVRGVPGSRIGWIVAAGGVIGLVAAYWIQWWANVFNYPLNSGGRPAHAVPAFVFPTFEGTVLLASLVAFFGLLTVLRLPRLWAPIDEIDGFERASVDRFWIAVDGTEETAKEMRASRIMREAGAIRTIPRVQP